MLAKARVLGLATVVTVAVVAWGVLVFLAIDHGRGPLDSARDWAFLGGSTIGAVVCMFAAIVTAARLRDVVRDGSYDGYEEPADPGRPSPSLAAVPPRVEDEGDWTALGKGLVPAQRTPRTPRPPRPAGSLGLAAGGGPSDSLGAPEPLRPAVLGPRRPAARPRPTMPGVPSGVPGSVGPLGLTDAARSSAASRVASNGRGRVEDDPSFVSYAGQGEPAGPADGAPAFEPQWANETGEHYYRDLGQRPASRHSAPAAPANGNPHEDPPPTTSYPTPGKRAAR